VVELIELRKAIGFGAGDMVRSRRGVSAITSPVSDTGTNSKKPHYPI